MDRPGQDADEQWCEHHDALAVGDHASTPLDDRSSDPRWELENAFYEALQAEAQGDADSAVPGDLEVIAQALAADAADDVRPDTSGPRRWVVALVAVAAALLLWVAWPGGGLPTIDSGTWIAQRDGGQHGHGDALPLAVWMLADDDACGSVQGATVCASAGSVVRISVPDQGGRPRIEIERGSVTIERGSWTVVTESKSQVMSVGETLAVQTPAVVASAQPEPPAVVPEPPTVATPPPPTPTIAAPIPTPKPPRAAPRVAVDDPATLIKRARSLRGSGDAKRASKTYAQLIEHYPSSAEANAARVALGQLRLRSGRAKSALRLFDRYLGNGGALAEEALWGKIQALDALGRSSALKAAVETLARRYPRSVYRQRAQERLDP